MGIKFPKPRGLFERTEAARQKFRDGGSEEEFRAALKNLGLSWA